MLSFKSRGEVENITINEAIKRGIRRVYDPNWLEKNSYILLPKLIEGKHSQCIYYFSDDTQKLLNLPTPQSSFISTLIQGLESTCVEYTGPISDKEDEYLNWDR